MHLWHGSHFFPHVPQLFGSLTRLTHTPGPAAVGQQLGAVAGQPTHMPVFGSQVPQGWVHVTGTSQLPVAGLHVKQFGHVTGSQFPVFGLHWKQFAHFR
jgi:hypothetical protein